MKRFKCALHQTNDFFPVRRNAIRMYLVSSSSSSERSGLKSEKSEILGSRTEQPQFEVMM